MMREVIRSEQLNTVIDGLQKGQWFTLYAPGGSGKTTFLAQLSQRLKTHFQVKYINLRPCAGLKGTEVLDFVASSLQPGLAHASSLQLHPVLDNCNGKLVLFLDDAGAPAEECAPLLHALSALRSESMLDPRLSHVAVVLTSSIDLQPLSRGVFSSLNSMEEYFLPDLSFEEVQACAGEDAETAWRLAAGHPWLTGHVCRCLARGKYDPRDMLDNPVLHNLRSRIGPETVKGYAKGKWFGTKRARQLRLEGLAVLQNGRPVVRNQMIGMVIEEFIKGQNGSGELYACQPEQLCLVRESKEVWLNGRNISLTPVEYRILQHLLVNNPSVIGKDSLAVAAYPTDPLPNADVESHIKNIRRKLGDRPRNPRYIRSRRGFGYQAVAGSFVLK